MTVIEDDCMSVAPVAIENEERDEVVSFSYSNGLELKHTMSDDPLSFVGWEVHGEYLTLALFSSYSISYSKHP
jgi:hypothetical protein